jgi:protein-ribulosamine 3-kinase
MEYLHCFLMAYEPGGTEGEPCQPHFFLPHFCPHQDLKLSLISSRHTSRYTDLFTVGNWGEFGPYTITHKISLDVTLPRSERRVRAEFGVIPDDDFIPDAALSTDLVQALNPQWFPLSAQTTNKTGPGLRGGSCGICLDPISEGDYSTTHLTCLNTFHKNCLGEWITTPRITEGQVITKFATCPLCAKKIVPPAVMTIDLNAAFYAAVVSCFPSGSILHSANEYRPSQRSKFSHATTSMLITVKLPCNTFKRYYMKFGKGSAGHIVEGEFQSMKEIRKVAVEPVLVADPFISKTFTDAEEDYHFFLCEFIEMTSPSYLVIPPQEVWRRVTELHEKSVSPTGKFGFDVQTYTGDIPQHVEWNSSWSDFFAKMLVNMKAFETRIRGPWEDDSLFPKILQEVVPRLIGALERDGRPIKPSLIHGNIFGHWASPYGTKDTVFYNPCSYFAHPEMEWAFLAQAGSPALKYEDRDVVQRVLDEKGLSEPKDEWCDRQQLYFIYFRLVESIEYKALSSRRRES